MSTIVEQRSHPLGGPSGYDYDHSRSMAGPQFTNPWLPSGNHMFSHQNQQPTDAYSARVQFQSAPSAPQPMASIDPISRSFAPESHFAATAAASAAPAYGATTTDRYSSDHYNASYNNPTYESRYPGSFAQPSARSFRPAVERGTFSDAVDASQGMLIMSQQDYTPRAQYPPRNGSSDSYGFPTTHSDQGSSVSSASSYPYYGSYGGSADGSVAGSSATDYSSASEDAGQRPLPPPNQMINGYPPDATQMMTQFNSKLAGNTQKKHKCKICEKRFTRPSSLQTHMYSHTGEKPFACDFDGCGRHFSVVSNLRRHKKCHKGEGSVDSGSPEA